ncbi:hypothetical protein [Micromonospora sp. HUAS LYJ1]|uniref:hypothetical protein n=1 Tax=Micromonospora sp. HUAS LYJ1 TaxID=3061626 RepID=UPI00267161D3|nr:hypothetical protein [Micromonospora sp. HUAS LYJ1]WKU07854.1 hypothetical protein Q2K16_12830 [Micromonospora sp. HUAS LYJ1]
MTTSESDRSTARRTLLRRAAVTGSAAVAGTAVTAANAAPAAAANGEPLTIGLPNQGSAATTLRTAAPDGACALTLQNRTGAPLQVQRKSNYQDVAGGVISTVKGLGVLATDANGNVRTYEAHTTANSTMLVPIPPTRILDTRSSAGRARLLEGAQRIDSQGRAAAETLLVVHLRDIVEYGDGLFGNVTVAKTAKGGFATVFGRGDLPNASTINWWSAGQLLSNGVLTQLGGYETVNGEYYEDVVAIYVQKSAAAVILDVTGLLVWHPDAAVINDPEGDRTGRAAGSGTADVRAREIRTAAERADRKVRTGV